MASISGMLNTTSTFPPPLSRSTGLSSSSSSYLRRWDGGVGRSEMVGAAGLVVECSSRPQKKATAHHRKTRPKKTQPWDVRRKGPTLYPSLPHLPPDWTLVEASGGETPEQEALGEDSASPV